MTRRLLFVLVLGAASFAAPAGAIPNTCPTQGPDAGIVNVDEPTPGATFAGQVTVRGRASAPTELSRVDLFVGEALKDTQFIEPAQRDVEYLLRFDVAGVASNRPVLTVVACGGNGANGVRGIASIEVAVDRASVVTAPPIAVTPVEGPRSRERTGPAWVGAAFGLAGLAGLVAATHLRTARGATAPSPGDAAAADRLPVPAGEVSPPRPSRRRPPAAASGTAVRGRRARVAPPAPAPASNGRRGGRRRGTGEPQEPGAGHGGPARRR